MSATTCPCGLCGKPTRMLGTKRCDACWELEHRIDAQPVLSARILANAVLPDAILLLDGRAYGLTADNQLMENGKVVATNRLPPLQMSKLLLIKAALTTAETSLL